MSVAEFLDGLPSYDKRNFSSFNSKTNQNKHISVYITTKDTSSKQIIFNDNSHWLLQSTHKQEEKKNGIKKRASVESTEESGSTSRKRARVDDLDIML